jgi:hypothetical protein
MCRTVAVPTRAAHRAPFLKIKWIVRLPFKWQTRILPSGNAECRHLTLRKMLKTEDWRALNKEEFRNFCRGSTFFRVVTKEYTSLDI